jgi:hypothetical protein
MELEKSDWKHRSFSYFSSETVSKNVFWLDPNGIEEIVMEGLVYNRDGYV